MTTRTAKEFSPLEVLTAANLNRAAGGWIGIAANSADQTGILAATDITNCSLTVTCNTNRLLLLMATVTVTIHGTVDAYNGTFLEDGSIIGRWARTSFPVNNNVLMETGWCVATPTAGTHTYKLQAQVTSSSGASPSIEVSGTSPAQAKLIVIDLGMTS